MRGLSWLTRARTRRGGVCVVGSSTRFLSGISYYTLQLANALAADQPVSVILMRQLLPTRLYPGHARVGQPLTRLRFDPAIEVCDGVDWYWIPSLGRALWQLVRRRPAVVVFQWWTSTVLHSYLALAIAARLLGTRVVVEFHEVLDPAEARLGPVRRYVRALAPLLVRLAAGYVVHSAFDRVQLTEKYGLAGRPIAEIPHGPYSQYELEAGQAAARVAPPDVCNLLFFGTIRPYKGLEFLVEAFDRLPATEMDRFWLTIVGETWEGWTRPAELISHSPHADRITFVNRYVNDREAAAWFAGADAVVLPYLRSSASGPLHVAMSQGLPTIVTRVGGLTEAVRDYPGAVLVEARDITALTTALRSVGDRRGQRYADPHSWARSANHYGELLRRLDAAPAPRAAPAQARG